MSKEEFNQNAKIENLIWEIAKLLNPDQFIEKGKIEQAKNTLLSILQ
jgi:hypothetical protein